LYADEPHRNYFVARFGQFPQQQTDINHVMINVVTLMYFMLTTLSTVGYGDYFPSSISEKVVGIVIQIVGVSIFSVLMN
jgi:hypothetical protein